MPTTARALRAPRARVLAPQALLVRLLRERVHDIVGEEDGDSIDIDRPPYRAGEIVAPEALASTIETLRGRMESLGSALPPSAEYERLVAFIDPIDGTREFCTGLGEQCSICIGFADRESGVAVGGLVYRPLCEHRSWALGCAREGVAQSNLRPSPAGAAGAGAFLCSNGGTSNFLRGLQTELGYDLAPMGGAGNKALSVLELPRACYVQDRGVSRWDTCAAEAVLDAHGGVLAKLHPVLAAGASAAAGAARGPRGRASLAFGSCERAAAGA